mmetsp:Transcript_17132/g.25437  ORF Transcript_17132/g.25437 Transcript_17132/m.25437 type:complete len:650 (-) Transcript_17132:701-2650(-)
MLSVLFPWSRGSNNGQVEPAPESHLGASPEPVISPLRQMLDAVNMTILPHDVRVSCIAQACDFFDHRDRVAHDSELREGAANVLLQKLAFALHLNCEDEEHVNRNGSGGYRYGGTDAIVAHRARGRAAVMPSPGGGTDGEQEIAMIASCLEMVHRASPEAIAASFEEVGTEALPLMVAVMERPFRRIQREVRWAEKENMPGGPERAAATAVSRAQKLAVQKITKLLAIYSLVPQAKIPMARCPGMLPVLVTIIDTHSFNRVRPAAPALHPGSNSRRLQTQAASGAGLYMTEAARFNTIATLTNLAAAEENRMLMLAEPSLVDNVARVVHNERSDVARQCSALAIMNLSNGDREHVPEMAGNELVLETILRLMKDDQPETRRNAAVALFNVACADRNTVRLARYRDGIILEALIEIVSNDDPNRTRDEARINAAETLFNMSCSEVRETTDRMADHTGLLESLAMTLRSNGAALEVKMYCAATLRRMAEIIHAPQPSQGALLTALIKASGWTRTACIAEAFRSQAEVSENRLHMAEHHGLLNALSKMALAVGGEEDDRVREAAVSAIELMSRDESTREALAHNEGVIMALTRASYGNDNADEFETTNSRVTSQNSSRQTTESDTTPLGDNRMSRDQGRLVQVALKNLVAAM